MMFFSRWHRVAPMVLVGAFALCADGAVAQEQDQEGWEFIPAPDEPCGVNCPDPNAPLGRVNYPSRDDNFKLMFVPTERGLRLVPNPHWNGTENLGVWCGVQCLDPYAPFSITNQLRRNDTQRLILVYVRHGDDEWIGTKQNPHWVGRATSEAVEAIEAITVSAPLPLLGLGALSSEADLGADEPGSQIVSGSLDRTDVAYHATGDDVFQPVVLQNIGGVLSQGSVVDGRDGRAPKVEFVLGLDGTYPGYVLVNDGAVTGRYRIRYDDLVPMALFVDSGGTSLYTLWGDDRLPATFRREAGFAKYDGGPGVLAIEFAGTRYADALYFLDTCQACVAVPDDDSGAAVNARTATDTEAGSERPSSYINTDVDSPFEVEETSAGAIEVSGGIIRFYWRGDAGTGERVSVVRKQPIVRPGELRANVDRWVTERENAHIDLLRAGFDLRKEGRILGRRRLADAFFLFETLALLRATKLRSPEDWSVFMAVLSSAWFVRHNREPWERYTETFCGVYSEEVECTNRDQAAAEQGNAKAQTNLGITYLIGRGVPQDDAEAMRWFRQAAEQGHAKAQFNLGLMYATGRGVPQDDAEAVRWYRLAADQGDASAQFNLGVMYRDGEGVPQDEAEAVRWFRLAADQGNALGQSNLGVMYAEGRGVPQDDAEAARWYRLAAEQGDVLGQSNLGSMYATGRGVPQDDAEAVRWSRLAAEQGNALGQYNLGVIYAEGRGVPQDDAEAVRQYRLAAEQGFAQAQFNLAVMYYNGEGVPQDLVLAHMWVNIAGTNGDETSRNARDILEPDMTPAEIRRATDLARTCMASDYRNCEP